MINELTEYRSLIYTVQTVQVGACLIFGRSLVVVGTYLNWSPIKLLPFSAAHFQ